MIEILQTCDGCGKNRLIERTVDATNAGWREVKQNKHLCAHCIEKAVGGK